MKWKIQIVSMTQIGHRQQNGPICGEDLRNHLVREQQEQKRMKKTEESLCDLWDVIKRKRSVNYWSPRKTEREKRPEGVFKEVISEKFLNLGEISISKFIKFIGPQTNSTLKTLLQRHIVIKLSKKKKRQKENLKSRKRKAACNSQRNSHKVIRGFLSKNFIVKREWDNVIKPLKDENCQPKYSSWQSCSSEMKKI